MSAQPKALRLADALTEAAGDYWQFHKSIGYGAAAELRRLHAENASLAAALASSCDEQRHELWESGGVVGCERSWVAERQRDALLEALKDATKTIEHLGYPLAAIERARAAIKAVQENT